MTTSLTHTRATGAAPLAGRIEDALRPALRGALPVGLRVWDGSAAGPADGPVVVLRDPAALRRLLRHPGELGAAQAYVTGELDVEGDLGGLLDRVREVGTARGLGRASALSLAKALPALASLARELGVLGTAPAPPASQAHLRGRRHSPSRDRSAIHHHYDLSNDFYELVLDPHLAYSCAWWDGAPGRTLEQAQAAKLDMVCRKLGLTGGSRLLDVGCGWGSLSLYAGERFGARVTGVTIAAEQKAFIDRRIRERGLEERVEIRLQDYRDLTDGPYDAVASLEMGEHVGQDHYPAYVRALRGAVRPGGWVLVQQMSRRGRHPGGGPFIEGFIAPDMHMRPLGETVALIEAEGLEVRQVEAMREHYVWTVEAWRERFEANWDRAVELVGEEVARVWRLYLVGGAQAFRDGRMGVDQILARRPDGPVGAVGTGISGRSGLAGSSGPAASGGDGA